MEKAIVLLAHIRGERTDNDAVLQEEKKKVYLHSFTGSL